MIRTEEMESMWKKAVVDSSKTLFQNFPGKTEKNQDCYRFG